eukprot:TRINITY_DN31672_c0_g1_i2.p1 TRINITY_DN31672_c0_g1~~TRINITY_DN31672_c0_g1_i2.p1  ORF type:complete len:373 (+),score=31.55 TRINITY_DN31672_c0_g1_i2:56-1120(+)
MIISSTSSVAQIFVCLQPQKNNSTLLQPFNQFSNSKRRCANLIANCKPKQVHNQFESYICNLQNQYIEEVQNLDGSGIQFVIDKWYRNENRQDDGYGITAVFENGSIFEKGAINVSVIKGVLSRERAWAMSERGRGINPEGGQEYNAVALSTVFHMAHPMIPTLRADVRMFQVEDLVWFGGGADLTPFYVFEEDFREFHSFWKAKCDKFDKSLYPEYKAWCDRYFYLEARKEHRGIGGLFFDDLQFQEHDFDELEFVQTIGSNLLESWKPIIDRRRNMNFSQENRDWQLLRRGRYLEFNLLYDRGVKFGLKGGRMESIMVSAPPLIAWKYNVIPESGSEEQKLIQLLKTPKEWV